jgi:hypothetical protein
MTSFYKKIDCACGKQEWMVVNMHDNRNCIIAKCCYTDIDIEIITINYSV